jgi:hypothetical protein
VKFRTTAVIGLLAIGGLGIASTPAQAASPIQITKVYVNSPGADLPVTNGKVNAEYTVIKNTDTRTRTLTNWTLRDQSSHVYKFGTFKLGPGKSVTVRNGRGTNTGATRYWGSRNYIWNNSGGDSATLRTNTGSLIDRCSWKTVATFKTC